MIKISSGNSKLGPAIPNISMVPIRDCGNCGHCRKDCYALKAWRQYKQTRDAWSHNGNEFRKDPYKAAASVILQLGRKKKLPRFFRIHVAGDFLNQDHLNAWFDVASTFPQIKFLAFTKMHSLDYKECPSNLKVKASTWPTMTDKEIDSIPKFLNKSWVQDGTETRIPANAIECPGICETCGVCWNLDVDVFFYKH